MAKIKDTTKEKAVVFLFLAGITAGYLIGKNTIGSIGYVPKRGQSSDFLSRRAAAISEIYNQQKAMEARPYSYQSVERMVYYDSKLDSFRMRGKGYDYTA